MTQLVHDAVLVLGTTFPAIALLMIVASLKGLM